MAANEKAYRTNEVNLLAERIQEWKIDVHNEQNANGVLARLYGAGLRMYQILLRNLDSSKPNSKSTPLQRKIQNGYTDYLIWADDYGARDGGLDTLLEDSQQLRALTIKLLIHICTILQSSLSIYINVPLSYETELRKTFQDARDATNEGKWIVHSTYSEGESDVSDNEESDTPGETLEECMEILSDAIQNLLDLGPRLEEPVHDLPTEVLPTSANVVFGNVQYFNNRVLEKFPKCQPTLAIALGRANWESFQRIAKRKESALDAQTEEVPNDQTTTLFLDSGLGSSMPSTNTETMTILSYGEGKEVRARIPQLPRNIKEGQLFPCLACGKHIVKRDMKMWKRHLLSDLRPWVCCQTSCPCEHKPFSTREEWIGHLRRNHALHPEWDNQTCPICSEVVTGGAHAAISHVAYHLEEISLAVLPCYPDNEEDEMYATLSAGDATSNLSHIERIDIQQGQRITPPPNLEKVHVDYTIINNAVNRGGSQATQSSLFDSIHGDISKLKTPVWYCCQCEEGPMTVMVTPECEFCNNHKKCYMCKLDAI
ncbi:hypothetical protein F4806DRAFT_25951 [Annulohypoxylon nitens]|nr:hypothetical protein F4806DRAFT_25951 [Annulohypoxylon nitens]